MVETTYSIIVYNIKHKPMRAFYITGKNNFNEFKKEFEKSDEHLIGGWYYVFRVEG